MDFYRFLSLFVVLFLTLNLAAGSDGRSVQPHAPPSSHRTWLTSREAPPIGTYNETTQGWTPQPNGRGTLDIIWSCVVTIFLCSWSVLCLNVPAATDNELHTMWRKFALMALSVTGPEFILQLALGQWISARRVKRMFRTSGCSKWTLTHAFFADMGGFMFHPSDWVPFPIDGMQLHYLVTKGYLHCPPISVKEIKDRNKVDTLLRVITVLQISWFVLNCLARKAQGLAITTFELTTIGFIFCTLGTHLCWIKKPADVEVPVSLGCQHTIRRILLEAGDSDAARRPYDRTPLDFVRRNEWSWSLWWAWFMIFVRKIVHVRFQPTVRPINRIPNDIWPEIPPAGIFALGCVGMVYAAIYMCGWNLWFATGIKRTLWRISTTTILAIVGGYLCIELYTFYLVPALPKRIRRWLNNDKTDTNGPN